MSVKLIPTVYVRIKDDYDLCKAFSEWQWENMIFPVRKTGGYSGAGGYGYSFDAEHMPKIKRFFAAYKRAKKKEKDAAASTNP